MSQRTIQVKVRFFGATAEIAGTREADFAIGAADPTAQAAFQKVLAEYPGLAEKHSRSSLLVALNEKYVRGDETLSDGDELAVFTAVSGG